MCIDMQTGGARNLINNGKIICYCIYQKMNPFPSIYNWSMLKLKEKNVRFSLKRNESKMFLSWLKEWIRESTGELYISLHIYKIEDRCIILISEKIIFQQSKKELNHFGFSSFKFFAANQILSSGNLKEIF